MKEKTTTLILLFFVIPFLVKSQNLPKDTIYGKIKRIREKVIFLTEIENPQLLYNSDYGHEGFMGSESTISRFYDIWFSTYFCYYINFERFYTPNRKIKKENWYSKNDSFMLSYSYVYDKKDRVISKIDSSANSIETENHYFEEYGDYVDENIIHENLRRNLFSHDYIKYKNGKIITKKNYNYNGSVKEYRYHYNKNGTLDYRVYKNPSTWKKLEGNSYSYGVQDSIGITYKDLIYEYDTKNQLTKTRLFDLDSDRHINEVIQIKQTLNIYEGDNLITKYTSNNYRSENYFNFSYNNSKQLVAKYCCGNDISNATVIEKYNYKNNMISQLTYEEEDFETKKMKKYIVSYSYKYDQYKNWIEIIKTVDGKDLYKWKREIEYY